MGKSVIIEKAKKISAEQVERAIYIGLSLFILIYPMIQYIWPTHMLGNQLQVIFLLCFDAFFLIQFGIQRINQRVVIEKKNIAAVFLLVMLAIGLISCVVNGKLETTVYGDDFQSECLLVHMAYYIMCLAAMQLKNEKYRKAVVFFLYLVLGFIAVYGIMQFFQVPFINHKLTRAAVYPTRNQNYYAAFPVLLSGLIFGKILCYKTSELKKNIFWNIMAMISFAASISSQSLLVFLGIIMQFVLAIFLDMLTGRKNIKKIVLLVVEFFVVYIVMSIASGGAVISELMSIFTQIKNDGTLLGDSVGSGRMSIWKETLTMIPEKWMFGYGIERLRINYVVGEHLWTGGNAHNEYLQIWATQGTFAIIAYLIFLFALFIPGLLQFIKKDSYESDFASKAAMFAFFGYIAQAFANIRVIQVAPYFWLCCGLLYVRKRRTDNALKNVNGDVKSQIGM